MQTLHKIRTGIMKVLGVLIVALFILMTVIGTYQIVTRYFFKRPSTVSEELLTYSFTWMALLASAYVFGKRDHMRMGFLADKITGSARKCLEIAIDLLTITVAGLRRRLHHPADHDPEHGFPPRAYGLHLRDRAGDRGVNHDLQPDQRHGYAAQGF